MAVFVLPNYLLILKDIDDEKEFTDYCLPHLNSVFQMKEPIQISIILMQNIELLLLKCRKNQETIKNYILPMICRCFDQNSLEVQDLCLQSVPNICYLIEQTSIKNSLLPKIKKLCLSTPNVSMKVRCLLCVGKIIQHLDKWIVIDDVINFLPEVNSREPACIMSCIGIYQLSFNHEKLGLTKEILCNKVIPHMLSLSIENSLNTNQFETIMILLKQMIQNVEDEHKAKLKQMDNMKSQQEMALVSFNQSSAVQINSQNILKSLDEVTNQPGAQLGGNTNVLNSSKTSTTCNALKPNLNSMTNSGTTNNMTSSSNGQTNKPDNFFRDLTSTLAQQDAQSMSNGKQQADYSHLINLDLKNNKTNKPKMDYSNRGQSSFDSIQVFPASSTNQPKPNLNNLNSSFNQQLQLTQYPANQFQTNQFGQLQANQSTMINSQSGLSIGNPGQYAKLNKSDLEDFLS